MNPAKKRKQPEKTISLDMTSTGNGLDDDAVYLQNEQDSEEDDVDEEEEEQEEQDGEEDEQEEEQDGEEEVEEVENKENIKPFFQRETRSGWKPNKKKLVKTSYPSPFSIKRPKIASPPSKVSKSDANDPKVKLFKQKYNIKSYEQVKVDKELDVEVQQWNNKDVIIFTRKSAGFDEFSSIQSLAIVEPLMNGLRFIKRRRNKELKDLANAPIEIKIGEGVYLRAITALSRSGNHYRSLRMETLKKRVPGVPCQGPQNDYDDKFARFYMKFSHVEPLLAALQSIFTPK
jgi:hypothetical protein